MYNPTKTMWQELKNKIQSEAPRYNLNNSTSSNQTKIKFPPRTKNKYKECQKTSLICTPPFCDGMPKGNQNPSSKGGGDEELRNHAKSARRPLISSKMSTKTCP